MRISRENILTIEEMRAELYIRFLVAIFAALLITGCQHNPGLSEPVTQNGMGDTGSNDTNSDSDQISHSLDTDVFDAMAKQLLEHIPGTPVIAIWPLRLDRQDAGHPLGERINDAFKGSLRDSAPGLEFVDRSAINPIYEEWLQSGRVPDSNKSAIALRGKTRANILLIGKGFLDGSKLCIRYEAFNLDTTRSIADSGEHCQLYKRSQIVLIGEFKNRHDIKDSRLRNLVLSQLRLPSGYILAEKSSPDMAYDYKISSGTVAASIGYDDKQRSITSEQGDLTLQASEQLLWPEVEYQITLVSTADRQSVYVIGRAATKVSHPSQAESVYDSLTEQALRLGLKKMTRRLYESEMDKH